jgi:hypothetical protein
MEASLRHATSRHVTPRHSNLTELKPYNIKQGLWKIKRGSAAASVANRTRKNEDHSIELDLKGSDDGV